MAGPVVRSINLSSRGELQTVSWSLDDRLAVSTDKDIIIMKLDVFCGGSNSTGSEMKTQAIFSTTHLTERPSLWPDLQEVLKNTSREVKRELRQRWTYGHLGPEQFNPCWTSLQWSPPGLAPNNRTVLAGVTTDHRLIISGLSTSGRPWVQLADLGDQLASRYKQDLPSTHTDLQDVEMAGNGDNNDNNNVNSLIAQRSAAAVMSAYTNMTSLAPVDMLWSHVMRGGKAQDRCVLLFAAMKNGDIVTWNITLPCTGIESCCIVDRQRASCDGAVCSLAWSALPGHPQAGILAVGYTDGRVEGVCFSVDPEGPVDVSPYRFTHKLHPHLDYLPAATLAWFTDTQFQDKLTLLSHKKDTLQAQVVSVDFHGNRGKEEGGEWRMEVGPSCQVAMDNGKDDAKVVVSGSTAVLLTTGGHIYHLAITTSNTEVGVQCVGEVEIQQPEEPWSCVSMALSPNTALIVTLLRPHFAFNHLNEHFRQPMKVYVTPLATGWTSLANLMFSLKGLKMSTTLTDILHLACHTLMQEPVTEETVTMVTERLKAPPFSDDPVGWRVSRYILYVLKNLLEPLELTDQVEVVMSAQQEVTDRLLCHQITTVCQALERGQSPDIPIDGSLLNMMLTWVNQEEQRSEVIGSELVGRLRSIVGEPRSDVCVLCDNAMDLTNGTAAMCVNNHKFGLCCHTLAVCQNLTHQCCVTCGAIALSAKMLRGLPWMEDTALQCTLCQSFLYSVNSFIRF